MGHAVTSQAVVDAVAVAAFKVVNASARHVQRCGSRTTFSWIGENLYFLGGTFLIP